MTLEAYKKLVNKETTKSLLKKILIVAKENSLKDNADLVFEPNEIEIIDKIIIEANNNEPWGNFITENGTIELLDYVISNIYGNAMAEYTEPITYVMDKFNLSLFQDEYEILEELRHYLANILD